MENQEDENDNLPAVQPEATQWFDRPAKRFSTKSSKIEDEVLRAWFEIRATANNDALALSLVASRTGYLPKAVEKIIGKYFAKEEARIQRREYADEIYKEKIPIAKTIVSLSLDKLAAFIENVTVVTMDDARGLSKIATDMNVLLRLELGQSTNISETVIKTEKSVHTLLSELKEIDPFVDYEEAEYRTINEQPSKDETPK